MDNDDINWGGRKSKKKWRNGQIYGLHINPLSMVILTPTLMMVEVEKGVNMKTIYKIWFAYYFFIIIFSFFFLVI